MIMGLMTRNSPYLPLLGTQLGPFREVTMLQTPLNTSLESSSDDTWATINLNHISYYECFCQSHVSCGSISINIAPEEKTCCVQDNWFKKTTHIPPYPSSSSNQKYVLGAPQRYIVLLYVSELSVTTQTLLNLWTTPTALQNLNLALETFRLGLSLIVTWNFAQLKAGRWDWYSALWPLWWCIGARSNCSHHLPSPAPSSLGDIFGSERSSRSGNHRLSVCL